MREQGYLEIGGYRAAFYRCNTVIVGTGAAGYNAADRLWQLGQKDILMVTENRMAGTSRNTGSDKQTYYKLTLSGGEGDSVEEMARTLFEGQCVDGDLALCEAALSAQCFLRLAEMGVEFPQNRYGEYVGYKTDHDPRRRATSAGPYTSRQMTECLEQAVIEKGITILDHRQVIRILSDGMRVYGLLCLNTGSKEKTELFTLIRCQNVVYATGGPAGMYAESAYPAGHYGATGLAFEAGVKGKNLTEWQYGMASVCPRWNVSGTYMQALPRVYSVDTSGGDQKEFLMDFFETAGECLSCIFLKGYQWPFDVRKALGGSSVIDLLVYQEQQKGRKVFLDYTKNPCGKEIDFTALIPEAREYLERAGACFGTPYQRLLHMNAPAVEFYRDRRVDLKKDPLEISLCAQHNNGGLAVNHRWQTNIEGLFAVGEVSGTHGVCRPGGAALNAGQVGSTRAAQYIAAKCGGEPEEPCAVFEAESERALQEMGFLVEEALKKKGNMRSLWKEASRHMSACAAAVRNEAEIRQYEKQVSSWVEQYGKLVGAETMADVALMFRLRDMLLCQKVYLGAMKDYICREGKSRGSVLYTDPKGVKPDETLPELFRFRLDEGSLGGLVQEVFLKNGKTVCQWRAVRPIPQEDDFFENVWRDFREGKIMDTETAQE